MKTPYFAFYPQDWLSDPKMAQLTYEERGVYFELLCRMWTFNDGTCTLPDNDAFIARVLGVRPSKWQKLKDVLVDGPAPVLHRIDGKITNKRLLEEYDKARDKSHKASANAKKKNENKNAGAFQKSNLDDDNSLKGEESALAAAQRTDCYRETDTDIDSTPPSPIGAEGENVDIPKDRNKWIIFFQRQGYDLWYIRRNAEVTKAFDMWVERGVSVQLVLDAMDKARKNKPDGKLPITYFLPIVEDFIHLRDRPAPVRNRRATAKGNMTNVGLKERNYDLDATPPEEISWLPPLPDSEA